MLLYRRNRRLCNVVLCSLLILSGGGLWAFLKVSRARDLAERTLALYQAGQSELENVSQQSAESIARLVRHHLASDEESRALAILEEALFQDPDNPVLLREMGVLLFTRQQFNEAISWFKRGAAPNGNLFRLAEKYAEIKPDSVRLLSVGQMIDLLSEMDEESNPGWQLMVKCDQRQRFDLRERAEIIECYLRLTNPEWTDGWFDYQMEANRLKIGGKGLQKFPSFLSALNLRELDLSGSDVSNLWNVLFLAIERLDIHDTPIREVWPIKRFVYLRELVIDEGQLPGKQYKQLPEQVKITQIR
jgi:tetratricopeptide (TPR) repeat protein